MSYGEITDEMQEVLTPLVDGKLELLESRSLNVSQFATELPRRLR